MNKLTQLVEQSKKTMLSLQQQSEQCNDLLSADHLLCEFASSSISSLLCPFSLNQVNQLNQAVSVAPFVADSSLQHHAPLSMPVSPTRPLDLSASQKRPVHTRGTTASPVVLFPPATSTAVGTINPSENQLTVTKILNRFSAANQVKTAVDEKNTQITDRHTKTTVWQIPSAGEPDRNIITAKPATRAAAATGSAPPAVNEPKNWFDSHSNFNTAASCFIADKTADVDKKMLLSWLKPASTMQKKSWSGHEKKTPSPAASSTHFADHPAEPAGGWDNLPDSSPQRPAQQKQKKLHTNQTTLHHEQVKKESQHPAQTSQLEKLVQSWQKTKNTETDSATGKAPVDVHPHKTDDLLSLAISAPSDSPALRSTPGALETQKTDTDHIFTDTLERVLQREMRRHGLGDEKI